MALTPDPGGEGAPPAVGKVDGQEPDLLVLSAGKVVNAQTIHAHDLIYGVAFSFTIPMTEYMGEGPDAAAGLRAEWIQAMAQHEHVVALTYTQDANRAGGLVDEIIVTVGTPDESSTADVAIPLAQLNTPGAFQRVDDLYAVLAKSIGL